MESTNGPRAIEVPKRATPWMPSVNVTTHLDGSTEEGAAFRGASNTMVEDFVSFTRVLSEAGIGPVIAWGDIAMVFHGIPTVCVVNMQPNSHIARDLTQFL